MKTLQNNFAWIICSVALVVGIFVQVQSQTVTSPGTGGGSGGAAPVIGSATHMTFTGKKGSTTTSDLSIVEVITGADNNLWVRSFVVEAVSTNTASILLRTTTESDYFTELQPGNQWVFTAAPGGVVNLENLVAKASDSGTPALTVVYLE